ncbi:hypothetical protein Tco_0866635, partial [Tanacetum coccineum]
TRAIQKLLEHFRSPNEIMMVIVTTRLANDPNAHHANALRRRAEALGQRANERLQKDLVIGCFRYNARGIMTTCKAYTKGVQVEANDTGEEAGSRWFKSNVER